MAPRRWLLVDQAGRPHRLVGPSSAITIGRVAAATGPSVAVVDASVSRRHAVVTQVDDRLHVSDAGSTNGTWLQRGTELLALDGQGAFAEAGDLIVTVNGLVLAQVALESPEVRT